jgi:hypothetical protein
MRIDGRCHCGQITFEADAEVGIVGLCHCSDCQTLTGSARRASILVPARSFVLRGETPTVYVKTADSGNRRGHAFCPTRARRSTRRRSRTRPRIPCASGPSPSGTSSGRRAAGCSLAQFCASTDVSTVRGAAICFALDWNNDEPLGPGLDCKLQLAQGQRQCVPAR